MTSIANFGASHSSARSYVKTHHHFLQMGEALMGTSQDERHHIDGVSQFQSDTVQVNTNRAKNQVLLSQKLEGEAVDPNFVSEDVDDSKIVEQTYRQMSKPNEYGTLEITERVDSRDAQGKVIDSWTRIVETDPQRGGFSIHIPGR